MQHKTLVATAYEVEKNSCMLHAASRLEKDDEKSTTIHIGFKMQTKASTLLNVMLNPAPK